MTFRSLRRFLRRRRNAAPSILPTHGKTVGLDHIAMRGAGRPAESDSEVTLPRISVVDYERREVVSWPDWQTWRRVIEDPSLRAALDIRTVGDYQARSGLIRMESDFDYAAVRSMMVRAGMAVTPFDTMTPEAIINGR